MKNKAFSKCCNANEITDLAMDWDEFRKIDHSFSETIREMKITNQKSSGRCWGFAGLNLFRVYLGGSIIFVILNFLKHISCSGIN